MDYTDLHETWNNYGDGEMYWSVITDDKFKKNNFDANSKIEFFLTGHENIKFISHIAIENNISFNGKSALDFGCGVGRLSLALSPHVKHVTGIDISAGHIAEANLNKKIVNVDNVSFYESNKDISSFGKFDMIISLIVLQHNRPPLMKYFINQLLSMLTENGCAFLHIPYFIQNYNPTPAKNIMEMHFIPINEIHNLAEINNCGVKQYNTDMCGNGIKNAIFLFEKL